MIDLGDSYEGEVVAAVINAVLDVRSDGTGRGGVIDPDRTFHALCSAIGIMARNVGIADKAAAKREFVDRCRKQIGQAIATAGDPNSGLGWMTAQPMTTQ